MKSVGGLKPIKR